MIKPFKWLGLFWILLFVIIVPAGCNRGAEPVIPESVPCELTLAGWVSSPVEEQAVRNQIASYMTEYPQVKVTYKPFSQFYLESLERMEEEGCMADIFYLDAHMAYDFMKDDKLLPLNDLMMKFGIYPGDFYPDLLSAFKREGEIYGIPKDFNTLGLFYNKAYFDKAGVPYPDLTWDWNSMKEASRKINLVLTHRGGYGLSLPPDVARWLPFAFQNGAKVLSDDGKRCCLDSKESIESMKFYYGLQKDGLSQEPAKLGCTWAGEAFGMGEAAMVIEGGWLIPYLKQEHPEIDFGVAQLPRGPKGRGNLLFVVAYCISKNTKYPVEAFRLLAYLTGKDVQKQVLHTGFALPSRIALIDDPYYRQNHDAVAILRGMETATLYRFGRAGIIFNRAFTQAMSVIFSGEETPEEALGTAVEQVNKVLQSGGAE
ncbi:MAG: sugar ABC transporter substrate-binding protein [Candidatus Eremiobacteraeota bacterium]|nr:sugar ABC transporter substrate-binding protein [Candidatus Eremiobacteraeota bacterium]